MGSGVKSIKRVLCPKYKKNRAFNLFRLDNSSTDISYVISRIHKRKYYQEFKLAMRELIKPQIDSFRKQEYAKCSSITCPINGSKVTYQDSHVDHFDPNFNELIELFIKEYNIRLTPELFPEDEDNQVNYKILDDDISNKFTLFHKQNANLRITSKKGNLKRNRR